MCYSTLNQAGFLQKVFLAVPAYQHKAAMSSFVLSLLSFTLDFILIAEGKNHFLFWGVKNPLILVEAPQLKPRI